MKVYDNITQCIGNTPIVRINRMNTGCASIYAKVESFNPLGSVKDRAALAMIEAAEKRGDITKDTVIIEPTSGNTGIGLAFICSQRGYRLVITMPESMSEERKQILRALGAELVLTPKELGMKGSIDRAIELKSSYESAFIPSQFDNPDYPKYHYDHTAPEIWNDMDGKVDVFIAGVGTGGTVTGIGRYLRDMNPDCEIIAVEPDESPVLSGGKAAFHRIQGIGANFVPGNYDPSVVDRVVRVKGDDAVKYCVKAMREEGIFCGISSGAVLKCALDLSCDEKYRGRNIVVLLPDSGERYISTGIFF